MGELVAEITAASQEQARGIEQVNMAVAQMDKVIQQNAAGAEELASAMAAFKTSEDGNTERWRQPPSRPSLPPLEMPSAFGRASRSSREGVVLHFPEP